MKAFRVSLAVAFVVLLALASARGAVAQTQTPWIDQTKTTDYIANLLSWYNLGATDSPNFLLYHGVGYNFRVFVLEATPNNDTLAVFAFFPIQANDPQVEIIANSSFYDLTGLTIKHDNTTIEGAENGGTHFIIGNTTFVVNIIFATLTSNVLTNTLANSEAFGKYLYRFDAAGIPPPNYYKIAWDILTSVWAGVIYVLTTFALFWYLYREGLLPHFKPASTKGGGRRGRGRRG